MRATCELQIIRAPTTTIHQQQQPLNNTGIFFYICTHLCRFTFRSIFRNIIIYDNAQSIVIKTKINLTNSEVSSIVSHEASVQT